MNDSFDNDERMRGASDTRAMSEAALLEANAKLKRDLAFAGKALADAEERLRTEMQNHQRTEQALRHSEILFRRLNEQLEEHVSDRTAELTATIGELEAFSYSISHDLRAPLRAINGYAAILRDEFATALATHGQDLLGKIEANASKMARLIDGLLDFSRLGRIEAVSAEVDMQNVVRSVVTELQADGEEEAASRVVVAALPRVEGDATMLRQVWVNLLTNAFKFSAQEPKSAIEIGAENRGDEIVYWVRDHGVGFDMAYAEKLFGVFNRLHRADEFPGVGVGLAIVRRIVQRHGGRVWADSDSARGTTFFFALPIGNAVGLGGARHVRA